MMIIAHLVLVSRRYNEAYALHKVMTALILTRTPNKLITSENLTAIKREVACFGTF